MGELTRHWPCNHVADYVEHKPKYSGYVLPTDSIIPLPLRLVESTSDFHANESRLRNKVDQESEVRRLLFVPTSS